MSALPPILEYLNAGGVLAVFLLIAWGFYTERIRFGQDFDDMEKELVECRAEIKELWLEKVADKEEKAELARAYLKIREADKL
jgi:hypothetical protein